MDNDAVDAAMASASGQGAPPDEVDQAMAKASAQDAFNQAMSMRSGDSSSFNTIGAALLAGGATVGSVAGGYRGIWDLATGGFTDDALREAKKNVQSTQSALTPTVNDATRQAMGSEKNPLNWPGLVSQKAGDATFNATGSPGLATGVSGVLNAAPMVLGLRGLAGAGVAAEGTEGASALGTVTKTLQEAGIKPSDVPPDLLNKMVSDVASGTARPDVIRAQAEAAQVGTKLSEGQATGDLNKIAQERELAKRPGQPGGDEYARLFQQQNQDTLSFLNNKLGAGTAMSPAEAGQTALSRLAQIDKQLSDNVDSLYSKVRDSQGRSANLDAENFYMKAQSQLEHDFSPQTATQFLPPQIAGMYDDFATGKVPLTVDSMTTFDKVLSRAQRSAADGNTEHAIGVVRSALNDTPVSSQVGQQAMQAYQQARAAARARFELADPTSQNFTPGYAAMLKGMGNASHDEFISSLENGTANADPAKWFDSNVAKATPAGAKKLTGLLQTGGATDIVDALRQGTISDLKNKIVQGNETVGNASISNAALNKNLTQRRQTLQELLPDQTMSDLQKLANTTARITPPKNAPINWSNTSAAAENMGQLKGAVAAGSRAAIESSPVGQMVLKLSDFIGGMRKNSAARKAAQAGVNPPFAEPTPTDSTALQSLLRGSPLVSGLGTPEQGQ